MSSDALWLTEQDVAELMPLPVGIDALERSVAAEFRGDAINMSKTMLQYGGHSNLHALGGQLGMVVGTKTWVHAEAGTCPMLLLWDARDGRLLAVVEAFALGNVRTGSTSGLATKWLSSPEARIMAIMGCGKQALSQVGAITAVRPIIEVRAYDRNAGARDAFSAKVERELGVKAIPIATAEEAAADADVVTLVTRATEPFLFGRFLKNGAHLNAIGAIGPDREEFTQDVFDRASVVCVDQLTAVKTMSREFTRRFNAVGWDTVRTLGEIVARGKQTWDAGNISVFKAMGMGLSDVAIGAAVLDLAVKAGKGRRLEQPQKAEIQLRRQSTNKAA